MEAAVAPRALVADERQRPVERLLHLVRADHAIVLHPAQDIGKALLRPVRMAIRVEVARSLGEAGEERAFAQGQRARRLPEIAARRHFDAPGPAAEKGRVEIEFEYLRFRERALEPRR